MKNQLKFSATNVTIDTSNTRLHDCPHCTCPSPTSRPQSPVYYRPNSPESPRRIRNNIYFQRSNISSAGQSSDRSFSSNKSPSAGRAMRVTIRYSSPTHNTEIRPMSPIEKGSHRSIMSSAFSFGRPEEPKKPDILNKVNKAKKKRIEKQETKVLDDRQIAQTLIQELHLNYDYFEAQDISDISADVSL